MAPRGGIPQQRRSASLPAAALRRVGAPRSGCPVSAVLLVGLVTVLLLGHDGAAAAWVGVLVGALVLLTVPIAVALWTGRMCECRFFAVTVAAVVGTGQVLAATVGGPGGTASGWTAGGMLVVVLAVLTASAVPGLGTLRAREARPVGAPDTYASSDGTPPAGRRGRRRDRRSTATDVGA